MKINLLRLVSCSLQFSLASFAATAALNAAPLPQTAAVHTKPDRASPAITYLKAGTEPTPASAALPNTPAGWMPVELPGPFEVYVENKNLTKALDVRPGVPLRLAPKPDAAVLTTAEKGDKTTITGLRGRWTQLSLEKKLVGYVEVGAMPGYLPPIAVASAGAVPATPQTPTFAVAPAAGPVSPAPIPPVAHGVAAPGQPAPTMNLGDGGASSLPRQFTGKFVSTRRPMTPRRPFDWALNDDTGKRYAYVDISKLMQTDQIEKYANRQVVVFGTMRAAADGKELVIQVESLQLR